ncbi:hypothetical protein NQZ68_026960 [Dissostichus eleginoides]|nr:hypothetical protein NQZ68_026960 [Dissostichus eleginoides]
MATNNHTDCGQGCSAHSSEITVTTAAFFMKNDVFTVGFCCAAEVVDLHRIIHCGPRTPQSIKEKAPMTEVKSIKVAHLGDPAINPYLLPGDNMVLPAPIVFWLCNVE